MKDQKSLKNRSVINSIIIAASIMILSLFFFIPYITEQYTIKTIIEHTKNSVAQIKLTRAYYVDVVVDDVKKYAPNLSFHYDHWGVDGRLPLPTTTIHDLSKIFSENTGIKYNLYSDYPFLNRKDRVLTQFQKDAIKYTQESEEGIYIKRDILDGKEVLRVATTDYMTGDSCVSCHNKHPDRTWEKDMWQLGDKRGVLEVITPLEDELAGHRIMRNYILGFVIITFSMVLIYLFFQMRRRENKLFAVADELENTVDDKNRELETLGNLLNQYVNSSKTDATGKIIYASQAFIDVCGYTKEELLHQPHSILRHPDMPKSIFKEMWKTIQSGETWRGEIKNLKKDGDFYWVDAIVSADYDEQQNIIGYTALRMDITSQKEAQYLAEHDFLTTLPNRAKFEEIAQHAIKIAKRDKTFLAVVFIDFDKFKNINDTLGHHVGDEMLKVVAIRLQNALREVDTVARIGGDEFVLLLESLQSINIITKIMDKVLAKLRVPLDIFGNSLHVTASLGISVFPNDGDGILQLMKNADGAMYHAKEKGRDNYQFYTQELNTMLIRRIEIENALREAILNESFDFVFQPKYNLKTQKSTSCEILLRLNNTKIGTISPAECIPIAEENRMIIDIGNIVFKKATQVFKEWQDIGLGIETISVNISSTQLEEKKIIENFLAMIEESGISAKNIELEITEHSIIKNLDANIKILSDLRSLGFKISIDDFGTGYSSMSYLKKLPIDTIKLDKIFIDDIAKNRGDYAIAHAIIQLAHDLNYGVVAEGIESEEQETSLNNLLCQTGQGFLYSKGLSNDEFISFISSDTK